MYLPPVRYVPLVGLLVLALAAPAQASKPRMTFHLATRIAENYWANRGVLVACDPKPLVLSEAETATWGYEIQMLTDEAACTIDITPWADGLRFDRDNSWMYCQEIVHEVGHIAGLEHSDNEDSIMAASPWIVPWGCSHPRKFLHAQRRARNPQFHVTIR